MISPRVAWQDAVNHRVDVLVDDLSRASGFTLGVARRLFGLRKIRIAPARFERASLASREKKRGLRSRISGAGDVFRRESSREILRRGQLVGVEPRDADGRGGLLWRGRSHLLDCARSLRRSSLLQDVPQAGAAKPFQKAGNTVRDAGRARVTRCTSECRCRRYTRRGETFSGATPLPNLDESSDKLEARAVRSSFEETPERSHELYIPTTHSPMLEGLLQSRLAGPRAPNEDFPQCEFTEIQPSELQRGRRNGVAAHDDHDRRRTRERSLPLRWHYLVGNTRS